MKRGHTSELFAEEDARYEDVEGKERSKNGREGGESLQHGRHSRGQWDGLNPRLARCSEREQGFLRGGGVEETAYSHSSSVPATVQRMKREEYQQSKNDSRGQKGKGAAVRHIQAHDQGNPP